MARERLYMEYGPDETARHQLLAWQAQATGRLGGRPLPAHELHLTLLHIGKLPEVLAELRQDSPGLSAADFSRQVEQFVEVVANIPPAQTSVRPLSWAGYGPRRDVAVLEVSADKSLQQAHAVCLGHLKRLLSACLQADPEPFMRRSANFRHALTFAPHITLLRRAHVGPWEGLPSAGEMPSLRLRLLPFSLNLKQLQ